MSNPFMEASRLKLRFNTSSGVASTEDLWKIPYNTLVTMEEELKSTVEKANASTSRRNRKPLTKEQSNNELRLNIVTEVLNVIDSEADESKARAEVQANIYKYSELIAKKQEEDLSKLSTEELKVLQAAELAKLK